MSRRRIQIANGSAGRVYATFDPAHKGGSCTLSGGNLVAAFLGPNSQVFSTLGKSSGKWYWEFTITAMPPGSSANLGISSSRTTGNFLGNQTTEFAYWYTGDKVTNALGSVYGATYGLGDNIGFALDMNAGTITMYKNGISQGVMFTGLSGTFYAAASQVANRTVTYTANFGASSFPFGVPAGYNSGLF